MSNQQKKKVKALKIRKKCKRKILTWAKSKYEIGFLCAGKKKKITHVYQIRNTSKFPLNRFKWDRNQKKKIKKKIQSGGLRLIAEGHSHPNLKHLKHPSHADLLYFSIKCPHFIVFPKEGIIRAWNLKATIMETKGNSIKILEV